MKKLILSCMACVVALAASAGAYISIPSYIGGSTNTIVPTGSLSTNYACSVAAASTNFYNLPNTTATTNWFQAIPIPPTLNLLPFNRLNFYTYVDFMGANSSAVTFRFAASPDASHWVSNFASIAITTNGTVASKSAITLTNAQSMPFWALQQIENPGAAATTNMVLQPVAVPGF